MTPTIRAELDRIEEFLMGPEGSSLIDVLSALRGPDTGNETIKCGMTNHVRVAAFPRLCDTSNVDARWSVYRIPSLIQEKDFSQSHFESHISLAAEVLEIGPYEPSTAVYRTDDLDRV